MGLRSIDTDIYRWVSVVYRLNWHSAVVSVEIDCDKLESPSTGIQEESFGSGKTASKQRSRLIWWCWAMIRPIYKTSIEPKMYSYLGFYSSKLINNFLILFSPFWFGFGFKCFKASIVVHFFFVSIENEIEGLRKNVNYRVVYKITRICCL